MDIQSKRVRPLLLKVKEAARLLGLGKSKVYEMTQTGELPVVRIGKAVRIPKAELEVWIRERIEQPV